MWMQLIILIINELCVAKPILVQDIITCMQQIPIQHAPVTGCTLNTDKNHVKIICAHQKAIIIARNITSSLVPLIHPVVCVEMK